MALLTKCHPHLAAGTVCNEYYRAPVSFAHLFLLPPWRLFNSSPPPPRKIMARFKKKDKPCWLIDTFRFFFNALRQMAWGLSDNHYNDVIMSAMASQITGVSIVCLTVSSGADKKTIKVLHHRPLWGNFCLCLWWICLSRCCFYFWW